MADWVRAKQAGTGHHITTTRESALQMGHQIIEKPSKHDTALLPNGWPRPAKPKQAITTPTQAGANAPEAANEEATQK